MHRNRLSSVVFNKSPGCCIIKQHSHANTIKNAKQELKVKKHAKLGRGRVHQEMNARILTRRTGQSGQEGMVRAAFLQDRTQKAMTQGCRHSSSQAGKEEDRPWVKTNQINIQECSRR